MPSLALFLDQWPHVERNDDGNELYLYHGTNCFRRWEINRSGNIEPGRSGYSFYTTDPASAYAYARASCLRDIGIGTANSLMSEPVVLQVRFNARTWMQSDFAQELPGPACQDEADNSRVHCPPLQVAVLGPIAGANILAVLHCCHERRLAANKITIRSFADGTLKSSIRRLREKTCRFRLGAYLLLIFGAFLRKWTNWTPGGHLLQVTAADELRRLYTVPSRR